MCVLSHSFFSNLTFFLTLPSCSYILIKSIHVNLHTAPERRMPNNEKSLESWIWDATCSIRGAKDASKYKNYILPLIFAKRLCDVFDDELNRSAKEVGSRQKALAPVKRDKSLIRFFLPLEPDNPDEGN